MRGRDRTSPDSAKMTRDVETERPQGKRTRGSRKPDLPCSGSWCRRGARAAVHTRGRPACSGQKGSSPSTGPVTVSRGSRRRFALPSTSPVTLSRSQNAQKIKGGRGQVGLLLGPGAGLAGGGRARGCRAGLSPPWVSCLLLRPRQHPQWSHPVTT